MADVLNLGITCRNEFLEGIKVFDSHGDEVDQSPLIGAKAINVYIVEWIVAPSLILVIPPLLLHMYIF